MMHALTIEPLPRLSERHFRMIAELVERQVGIKLPDNKRMMLEGRLQKRVRALAYADINDYVEDLFNNQESEAEKVYLIDCVTTNKTDFFRESAHFDFMRNVAVPDLLKKARGGRTLKIWSAACSCGMEAYTIAMVLDDMLRSGSTFKFRILGTDICTSVLDDAAEGIYTRETIAPVPPDMARRYFLSSKDPASSEVRVIPELRRSVAFMRMNLMDQVYPVDRDVDIIFCRNVLIYFDKPTQIQVVERLCDHLRPGGYLIVGHSESMIHSASLRIKQVQPTIFKV